MNDNVTAQEWFALGERVNYDPYSKAIVEGPVIGSENVVRVFRRIAKDTSNEEEFWTTFLPGFPDGSFGWAKVDKYLDSDWLDPKLFVEYIGQGDSDKPSKYPYSTMERADLVEALWLSEGIRSSFIVTFDYSSLVALELLSRQLYRLQGGSSLDTRIEGVLFINGGLFADAHSHPWFTSPLLKSPIGRIIAWIGQRSRIAFHQLLKPLFSKEYGVTSKELDEIYEAISRHNGAAFLHKATGFVDEHKANAERWDLRRVFLASEGAVSFHVAGSAGDIFEPNQIVMARERLGKYGLDVRVLPGGHMTTSEHPELLAQIIQEAGSRQRCIG